MKPAKGNGRNAGHAAPAKTHTNNAGDFTHTVRFIGTDNPRYLRAIAALLRRPMPRESLDREAGCSNGPALVSELRDLGLTQENLPCERIKFIDRDGKVCRPGVYSLTAKGRRMIYAWMAQRRQGGAI